MGLDIFHFTGLEVVGRGWELLDALQKCGGYCDHAPVLRMTGHAMKEALAKADEIELEDEMRAAFRKKIEDMGEDNLDDFVDFPMCY